MPQFGKSVNMSLDIIVTVILFVIAIEIAVGTVDEYNSAMETIKDDNNSTDMQKSLADYSKEIYALAVTLGLAIVMLLKLLKDSGVI